MGRMLEKDALRMRAEEFTLPVPDTIKLSEEGNREFSMRKKKGRVKRLCPGISLKMHDGLLGLLLEPPGIHENHAILHQSV